MASGPSDAPAPDAPLRGLVLAGGRSRRFGRDKAALVVAGQSLLERTVALLRPLCRGVFVAVRADQADEPLRRRFPVLVDPPGMAGPAAALVAAHRHDPGAAWLVVACDLAGLDAATLGALRAARGGPAVCMASPVDGGPEPLCALYEPATLARFARIVERGGDASPGSFLRRAHARRLAPSRPAALLNVNRPADLARLNQGISTDE